MKKLKRTKKVKAKRTGSMAHPLDAKYHFAKRVAAPKPAQ
jgi:hypothetical protein